MPYSSTAGTYSVYADYADSSTKDNALEFRRCWMEMMGLDKEEIDAHCQPGTPVDFDEEVSEYCAMQRIQQMNLRIQSS